MVMLVLLVPPVAKASAVLFPLPFLPPLLPFPPVVAVLKTTSPAVLPFVPGVLIDVAFAGDFLSLALSTE